MPNELKKEKEGTLRRPDKNWEKYFNADELKHFWWPSKQELEEWHRRWFSTSVEKRFQDPSLKHHPDFLSMISAIIDGEYDLVDITIEDGFGFLDFYPHAYPYGGTESMRELVKAFKHTVICFDDGTGVFMDKNE